MVGPGEELLQIADAAAHARARMTTEIGEPLAQILHSAEEAARAWSGSNIGYQATVYYRGLSPKPANSEFSPEWGLMDVWPTHQPDRGWEQMDHQSVIEIILKRAGDPDWSAIEDDLGAIADELRRLKESAVSVLSSVLTKDGYLERKLSEIEALSSPSLTAIQDSMIPKS